MNDSLGYLTFAVLCLALIVATYLAAGARRTHAEDLAYQLECDYAVMTQIADRADQLAAEGHHRPGTAAITEWEQRMQQAELNR